MKERKKYRAEVGGVGEDVWSTNAMTYDTEEEAKAWLDDLSTRWFGYDISRIVPDSFPMREEIFFDDPRIYQNYRKH